MNRHLSTAARILPYIALVVAITHAILDYQISTNAYFYWIVHTAINNGLTNYIDIYEPKPPGIFLLSEPLSILLSVAVLVVPITFRKQWIFGVLLALFTLSVAGFAETEYFGAFSGMIYVLSGNWILSSVAMFLAVGIKEPFYLALLSCAIVQWRPTKFVFSSVIVALVGVFCLWFFGMFEGYTQYYLPTMFGHRIVQWDPIWLRGFFVHKIIVKVWHFSPLMVPTIILLFIRPWREIPRLLIGLYLVTIAVGLGGDWQGHHFALLVPFFAALFCLKRPEIINTILIIMVSLSIIAAPFGMVERKDDSFAEEIARSVDAILDGCNVDRYLFVENSEHWMHKTKHTPLNYFPYSRIEHLLRYHIIVKEMSVKNIAKAQIVILDGEYEPQTSIELEKGFGNAFKKILESEFTSTPWDCAQDLSVPERIVLYRSVRKI